MTADTKPRSYSNMRDCGAEGCVRHCRDDGDAFLERISATGPGRPFVGLCQDHYGRPPIRLKPQAAALMEDEGFCPVMEDGSHCEHWWDGEGCHACGAPPMTEDKKVEQGMVEGPVRSPDAR